MAVGLERMSLEGGVPVSGVVAIPDEGLGNRAYLVDLGDGRALVVDPARDPSPYHEAAERHGLAIAFTAETHLHADFVSGSRELALRGASVLAPAAGHIEHAHRGLDDGDEVDLGGLTLRALATPGHTPEHLSYLLLDGHRSLALFSGGALLPSSAARTDLISADQTDALTRHLYRAVRARLLSLPDDLAVLPTHGAGSFCSAPAGGEPWTTVGRERLTNPLFSVQGEDEFVRVFLGGLGSYPDYFARMRDVNRHGPRVYGAGWPKLAALHAHTVWKVMSEGAMVVDARAYPDFARGHVAGSLSIALRGAFASWLGWIVPDGTPLVFVLDPEQDRAEVVRQCLKIGYEGLLGELEGGFESWRRDGLPEASVQLIVPPATPEPLTYDVRQRSEYLAGHLPGAIHIELGSLQGVADELSRAPLTLYCKHGERAMTAASVLERAGHRDISVIHGGFDAWRRSQVGTANRPMMPTT
jgi:glyoxylase-like metal-dependent hydrolase (beta-lactamase superfamily II)/rhodanese-related sulfurtransferase